MTQPDSDLARRWVDQLPGHLLGQLINALRSAPGAVAALRHGSHGAASKAVLERAVTIAANGDGPYLAGLLNGYRAALAQAPMIVPVWTGPESAAAGERLTLAVVAGLIDEARTEILLISYATGPSPEVRSALLRAATRGVTITAVLERSVDNPNFSGHPDPLHGIPHTAKVWPAAQRDPGASMHAKVLVIDRSSALVGSANLTGFGVERNLECGLLVRGGTLPGRLVKHVEAIGLADQEAEGVSDR